MTPTQICERIQSDCGMLAKAFIDAGCPLTAAHLLASCHKMLSCPVDGPGDPTAMEAAAFLEIRDEPSTV